MFCSVQEAHTLAKPLHLTNKQHLAAHPMHPALIHCLRGMVAQINNTRTMRMELPAPAVDLDVAIVLDAGDVHALCPSGC